MLILTPPTRATAASLRLSLATRHRPACVVRSSGMPSSDGKHASTALGPPQLILFYHIEKTGGNTVMHWLSTNAYATPRGLRPRLDVAAVWTSVPCFLATYPEVFTGRRWKRRCRGAGLQHNAVSWKQRIPINFPADRWQSSRMAIEFHDHTKPLFWSEVMPNIARLRRLYASITRGGNVTTLTVLRSPLQHLYSAWAYKPPLDAARRSVRLGFVEWARRHAIGLQAGWLASRVPTKYHPDRGYHSTLRGQEDVAAALNDSLRNLATFSIVGVLSCLPPLLRAVEAHAALVPIDDEATFARRLHAPNGRPLHVRPRHLASLTSGLCGPHGHEHDDAACRGTDPTSVWQALRANATAWLLLQDAVRYDDVLYSAARQRSVAGDCQWPAGARRATRTTQQRSVI